MYLMTAPTYSVCGVCGTGWEKMLRSVKVAFAIPRAK